MPFSLRTAARRLSDAALRVERAVLIASILGMAAVSIANVIGRSLLGGGLSWAEEVTQFLVILTTFLGASYASRRGRHIRMSALYDQLSRRNRKILMSAMCAGTAALLFFLSWHSLRYALGVRSMGTVSPALGVPLYLPYLAVPVGLALTGLQYLLALVKNLLDPEVYLSWETKADHDDEEPGEAHAL